MSLILDALSRAERDKHEQANAAPSILSQAQVPATAKGVRRPWTLWVAALLGFMGLAYLLWRLWTPIPDTPREATATLSPSTLPKQQEPGAVPSNARVERAPAQALESRPVAMQKNTTAVAALYAEEPQQVSRGLGQEQEPEQEQGHSSVGESSSKTPPRKLAKLLPAASAAGGSQTTVDREKPATQELIDVERVLREMRLQASNDTLESHPTPLLDSLSKQFRDRVPTLLYSFHDYSASQRSSVIINGETLSAGQRTRGVEVLEVLPDSVILRFESTDFRLRSLNSWVNL